ncbi:helix-turn-helix domain-containing protein [Sporolactobacillus sp. THM7-7]|nr:helix-turn-helix domain-containing protein [Sporolactobacillus sp. THM7-7]
MKEADFIMAYLKPSTKHRTFTHLNTYQRGQIQVLHQEQRSSREIARVIGCSHQTVLNDHLLKQVGSDINVYDLKSPFKTEVF